MLSLIHYKPSVSFLADSDQKLAKNMSQTKGFGK